MATHDYTEQLWGHAISNIRPLTKAGEYSMLGHGEGIKKGDTLTMKMQSGRTGKFYVQNVEYFLDPRDMWKLGAKFAGYTDSDGRAADAAETRDAKG